MTRTETVTMTNGEFAHLGEGSVAYLRKVSSDELLGRFPNIGEIAPGLELWALFAANGQPILLSDARDRALAGAMDDVGAVDQPERLAHVVVGDEDADAALGEMAHEGANVADGDRVDAGEGFVEQHAPVGPIFRSGVFDEPNSS